MVAHRENQTIDQIPSHFSLEEWRFLKAITPYQGHIILRDQPHAKIV